MSLISSSMSPRNCGNNYYVLCECGNIIQSSVLRNRLDQFLSVGVGATINKFVLVARLNRTGPSSAHIINGLWHIHRTILHLQ